MSQTELDDRIVLVCTDCGAEVHSYFCTYCGSDRIAEVDVGLLHRILRDGDDHADRT